MTDHVDELISTVRKQRGLPKVIGVVALVAWRCVLANTLRKRGVKVPPIPTSRKSS